MPFWLKPNLHQRALISFVGCFSSPHHVAGAQQFVGTSGRGGGILDAFRSLARFPFLLSQNIAMTRPAAQLQRSYIVLLLTELLSTVLGGIMVCSMVQWHTTAIIPPLSKSCIYKIGGG